MKIDANLPKEKRILQAAETVFSRFGYEKATLDEIIKLADVGKGTVYKYFGNKEQLFYKLVSDKNEPFVERLQAAVKGNGGLSQKLRSYFKEMIEFYVANSALWQVICFEKLGGCNICRVQQVDGELQVVPRFSYIELTDEVKQQILCYHHLIFDEYKILQALLKQAMADGFLKNRHENEDPDIVGKFIFFGVAMSIFNPNEDVCSNMTSEELSEIVVDRFLYGHGAIAAE